MNLVVAAARTFAFFAFSAMWLPLVMLAVLARPGTALFWSVGSLWLRGILAIFGAKLEVSGLEHVSAVEDAVILANHRSQLDPPAIAVALLPRMTRWVAKKELRRVPIFGRALAMTGQIFVDRSDTSKAVDSLERHAGERGVFVCFFPEGRRAETRRLLPFKKGGAAFAIANGMPVLPVAVSGSEHCLPNRSMLSSPGTIRVAFGPPIHTRGLGEADRGPLTGRVRRVIEDLLEGLEGPAEAPIAGLSTSNPGVHAHRNAAAPRTTTP